MKLASIFARALTIAALALAASGARAYTIEDSGAEQVGDFVLEPAKVEVFLDPGETATRSVSIVNRTGAKVEYQIELEDFVGTDDGSASVKFLGDADSPYSFKKGIQPEVKTFTLEAGQRARIPVDIVAPENAAPGGYYTSLIVSNKPSDAPQEGSGTRVVSRVAQLIFVRVNGPVVESGILRDFRLSPPGFFRSGGPFTFEVLFENQGSVHLAPYGVITIYNLFGQVVAQVPVDAYYAMPKSQRYRQVNWDKPGLFGFYRAELELNAGYKESGDKIETRSVSVLVIPWLPLTIVLVAVLLIAGAIVYVRRNFVFRRRNA
jgi:hypothetical protein